MADLQPVDVWNGSHVSGAGAWGGFADDGLARLAADFLQPAEELDFGLGVATRGAGAQASGDFVLALEDVIGDGNGEVVFCNEAGLSNLTLRTDAAVVDRGTAAGHAPVDGQDINGFAFVSFDSGLTLYYPEGLDLSLAPSA